MRLSELIETAGVAVRRMVGDGGENIERVVCDSREAAPETLFVCIRGFTGDGHAYAARAYAAGCRAFLAEAALALADDAAVVYTDNTRRALAQVSAAFFGFPARDMTVIGITGTKGKTTTALMTAAILYTALFSRAGGGGAMEQHANCMDIEWDEVQPGGLAVLSGG